MQEKTTACRRQALCGVTTTTPCSSRLPPVGSSPRSWARRRSAAALKYAHRACRRSRCQRTPAAGSKTKPGQTRASTIEGNTGRAGNAARKDPGTGKSDCEYVSRGSRRRRGWGGGGGGEKTGKVKPPVVTTLRRHFHKVCIKRTTCVHVGSRG